ncbi:MAG: 5-methyltetrahydropteroyltriglutamate--homocysteine S-methyltransferase [Alphaproteobacteria bacterium]
MSVTRPADPPFRAEHIGSLIRPPALIAARADHDAGKIDAAALAAAEDAAIRDVVALQEAVGLSVVTDGEFRRNTYSDSFTTAALSGVEIQFTEDDGWKPSAGHGARTAMRIPKVVDRIEWKGSRNADDFRFLASVATQTPKITLPGPGYIHYRAGRVNISKDIYPDLDAFWSDLVGAYHRELDALAEAGCGYVQIDETSLVKLGDPRARALLAERGDDWRDLLNAYIEAVNAVVAGAPDGMRIGVHICRSQDPNWQADIGYDPIAERLFNDMAVNFFFLEYDTERAGTFDPLRFVPEGKTIVLGLVATKNPALETADALKRRIEEASRFIALDQLALSPQCGFATSADQPDAVTPDMQKAKLARVVEVSRDVWSG